MKNVVLSYFIVGVRLVILIHLDDGYIMSGTTYVLQPEEGKFVMDRYYLDGIVKPYGDGADEISKGEFDKLAQSEMEKYGFYKIDMTDFEETRIYYRDVLSKT